MTLTVNTLTSGSNASWNATTASINPATTPVLVAVAQAHDFSFPGEPSVSGCGLTWAVLGSVTYASRRRLTVLQGTGTPTSGALTITGPSDSGAIGLAWAVVELGGVDSLGAVATASGNGTAATTTLSGSPVTGDWAWAAGAIEGNTNPTWEAAYTEEYDVVQSGNVRRLTTAHSTTHDSTPRFTWSGADGWAIVGFYVIAAAGGGTDALTPNDLATGAPALTAPAIGQIHALGGGDLTTGAPALTAAALGQVHVLTADDLTAGTPTLDSPVLGASHVLTGDDVTAGTPTLGTPALGQIHALTADDLSAGTPALDSPALGQVHALTGDDLVTAAPILSTPVLSSEGTDALTADDLTAVAPTLTAPALGQVHALSADDLTVAAPILGAPALAQIHALAGDDLITGAPALTEPTLTAVVAVIAAYGTVTSPAAVGAVETPLAASWEYILTETGEWLLTEDGAVLETESSSAARATAVIMPAQSGAVAGPGTMVYEYVLTEAGGALETEMSGVTAGAVQMPAAVGRVVTQETL